MICRIRNPTYEIGETCLGKPDMPPFALQKNSGIPINRDTTIKTSGMDGCWCAPRTSNPPAGTNTIRGEFDSHPFPLQAPDCYNSSSALFYLYNLKSSAVAECNNIDKI